MTYEEYVKLKATHGTVAHEIIEAADITIRILRFRVQMLKLWTNFKCGEVLLPKQFHYIMHGTYAGFKD
jgi:hypothetical protein